MRFAESLVTVPRAAVALALMLSASTPAVAAKFSISEDEEGMACVIELDSKEPFMFTAIQGGGITGPVILHLSPGGLDNIPPGKELRIELNTYEGDPSAPFLGYVDEMNGDAAFVVPLSLMAELSSVEKLTYQYEQGAAIEVPTFTKGDLDKFMACMKGP